MRSTPSATSTPTTRPVAHAAAAAQAAPPLVRAGFGLLAALLPLLVVCLFTLVSFGTLPGAGVPTLSDEIMNWHQVHTVRHVGLDGGYYTINEIPARSDLLRLYMHGPVYPLLYSPAAWALGWTMGTVTLINMACFGLGLVIFALAVPLTTQQLMRVALVSASYYPLLLYLPTAMQEALNMGLGLALAALLYHALRRQTALPLPVKVLGGALFAAGIATRMSWGLLLLPYLVLILPKTRAGLLAAVTGTLLLGGAVVMFVGQFAPSTEQHSVYRLLALLQAGDVGGLLYYMAVYAGINIRRYLSASKPPADIAFSLVMWWIIILMGRGWLQQRRLWPAQGAWSRPELAFHLVNLVGIFVLSVLLYIVGTWGDYRVMGAHLLVSMMLFIAFDQRRIVRLYLILNLLLVPAFIASFHHELAPRFDPAVIAQQRPLDGALVHTPHADPWCNSLAVSILLYQTPVAGVPAGVGINILQDPDYGSLKSRYLWLTGDDYAKVTAAMNVPALEPAVPARLGLPIYSNPRAQCGSPPPLVQAQD